MGLSQAQQWLLPSSESVGNSPRLRAHHLLSSLLHLLVGSELPPTALLLEAPRRARTSHIQQLTRQRRIKQTSKQTDSINPQINNCLRVSGWLMGRGSSHVSLTSCGATGTAGSCTPHPAPLTLAISSCSSSSVCSDSRRGREPSPTVPGSRDPFLLPSAGQRRGEVRLAGSEEGRGPT